MARDRGALAASLLLGTACPFDSAGFGDEGASSGLASGPTSTGAQTSSGADGTTSGTSSASSTGAATTPPTSTSVSTDVGTDVGTAGSSESASSPGTVGDDGSSTATGIEAELEGLRIELPCMEGVCPYNPADVCAMDPTVAEQRTLTGEATVVYDVTLRVRGVVEMSTFIGGVLDGPVYVGGDVDSYWSAFSLVVSDPAQTYWLNPLGDGDLFTYGVDYLYTLPIADGATVELRGGSGDDACGLLNHDIDGEPIVVAGIRPAPAAFDGQLVQVDVESIIPLP